MKTILITGAAGFIGRAAVTYFAEHGYYVRALIRPRGSRGDFFKHPHVEFYEGDLQSEEALDIATKGVSAVIHLAGAKQDEKDSFEINVGGAKNLVAMCRKNGVVKIINVSTSSTKILVRGAYGESKRQADEVFSNSGLDYITLKPSLVYSDLKSAAFGSLAKFSRLPITPVFGDGTCLFRPIHVHDLVKTFHIALEDSALSKKTYDIVGPDIVSMSDIIKIIGNRFFHKKVRIVHAPIWIGNCVADVLSKIFYKSPITRSNILGSTQNIKMDHQTFFRDFKFTPRSLHEGFSLMEKEYNFFDEATLFLAYAASRSFPKIIITNRERELFYKTLAGTQKVRTLSRVIYRFPMLLGALDFLSRFYPGSALSKKIYVALTILECSPQSAPWLLPKKRSLGSMFMLSSYLVLSWVAKVMLAVLILPFRKFIEKNVR